MRPRLLTDQPEFTHKTAYLEATNFLPLLIEEPLYRTASRRAATLIEQAVHFGFQGHTLRIKTTAPLTVFVVTGTMHIKR